MEKVTDLILPPISQKQIIELSPITLAFIGDGVHTMMIRDSVVKSSNLLVKSYHKLCAEKCNAKAQSIKLDSIIENLHEDELDIVRRAKNAKNNHVAKNSDEQTYKKATAFEAVIGYLYLLGKYDRIKEIVNMGE